MVSDVPMVIARCRIVFAFLVAALLLAPGVVSAALAPGDYQRSVMYEGIEHEYFLTVPPATNIGQSLVLLLHGGGGNAQSISDVTELREKAREEGFLLVVPEGFDRFGINRRVWNAGGCCGQAMEMDIDHVGAMAAILDAVAAESPYDPARVYATGHSNGGMMSYRLACELSERIAAIAPNASYLLTENLMVDPPETVFDCRPSRPVPVLHLHGLADQCAPFEGGPSAGDAPFDRPAAIESVNFWVSHNQCSGDAQETYRQGNAQCVSYAGCVDDASVTLCTVEGAGHVWPGSLRYPSRDTCGGVVTLDLIANDLIWDFFAAHTLDGSLTIFADGFES